MLCWRRGFELLWQRMQVEKIIDYIHLQRYNDQFLLTCHFVFWEIQKINNKDLKHLSSCTNMQNMQNMQNMHNISANMP